MENGFYTGDIHTAHRGPGYSFQTIADFCHASNDKTILLRHDVDLLPQNALRLAKLEHGMGIKATYYFRAVPVSWDEDIIREIARMGHEIGYHYENIDSMIEGLKNSGIGGLRKKVRQLGMFGKQSNCIEQQLDAVVDLAYEDFCQNLEMFRKHFDVKTVCMHGSPLSKYDNRMIWEKYDYKELGILAEPYFDVDFNQVHYLTDTGRRWNHTGASIRDRVDSGFDIEVKSTEHLIELIKRREEFCPPR